MNSGKILTTTGIALIIIAWCLAARIPKVTYDDLNRAIKRRGIGFGDTGIAYRKMCADRRILQNFYIGASGLILLGIGIVNINKNTKVDWDRTPHR